MKILGLLTLLFISTISYGANVEVSQGLQSLNGLTPSTQVYATGTSGSDFGISSSTSTHTFNIPDAGASARGLVTTGTQTLAGAKTFSTSVNTPSLLIGGGPSDTYFFRTCTLTSAAAITPVTCLADADVPTGKKVYINYWHAKVNGATGWGTVTTCTIADSTPTTFITIAVAALTNAAFIQSATANVTLATPFSLGTGGGTGKGLQVACNANGSGSDLVFVISGVIK